MTTIIIIALCVLLLVAYVFNLTASKTRIPPVILLLLFGWGIKEITSFLSIALPDFSFVLPVLATIGLVLIVLEGSLDLELTRSRVGLIRKSVIGAIFPIVILSFLLCYLFQYYGGYPMRPSLINAIPLCIISSAVAIPSVINLTQHKREFVIYESSFSDIIGVLFFNFVMLNETIDADAFGVFGLQLVIMIFVSIISTIMLSLLLNKIDHHVKFVPIILLVILIYSISKLYHLPALIFILIFGLAIGNLQLFKRFKWLNKFKPESLQEEITKFKELTVEGAFLVRALFFIMFGYLIEVSEVVNVDTIPWAVGIVTISLAIRVLQLKLSGMEVFPLVFVAPRGLITILLFLSIAPENYIGFVNRSLIIQLILLTALIMTVGLMFSSKRKEKETIEKAI